MIDKAAGAERKVVGHSEHYSPGRKRSALWRAAEGRTDAPPRCDKLVSIPASDAARQWQGWASALKPAVEEWWLLRKPNEGTFAENAQKWGVSGIAIDRCRVGTAEDTRRNAQGGDNGLLGSSTFKIRERHTDDKPKPSGRWPANLIHDGSDEVLERFPNNRPGCSLSSLGQGKGYAECPSSYSSGGIVTTAYGDTGSAARFFYCAKASRAEREKGCEGLETGTQQSVAHGDMAYGTLPYTGAIREIRPRSRSNYHPTVKPLSLMKYLITLLSTPTGGVVLDPFLGSGTTMVACAELGRDGIGIEIDPEYMEIARARVNAAQPALMMCEAAK